MTEERKPVERIASAAYKTLVDSIIEEHRFQLPDYGSFRESVRPYIEAQIVDAQLEMLEKTGLPGSDLLWRRDTRHALLKEKWRLEMEMNKRSARKC